MTIEPKRHALADQLPWVTACAQAVSAGRNVDTALSKVPSHLRAGVQALTYDVLRQWAWAQAVLPMLASKKPSEPARLLLVCCIAMLREPSHYVSHVVVDEAVKACKASHKLKNVAGFVNASLRTLLRDYETLNKAALNDWVAEFNHPIWWIKRLRDQYPMSVWPLRVYLQSLLGSVVCCWPRHNLSITCLVLMWVTCLCKMARRRWLRT